MVRSFQEQGFAHIRAVDVKPLDEWYQVTDGVENLRLDLRDEAVRLRAAFLEADSHIDLTASVMPVHLPVWVPTPRNRRFRRAMATLDGFIYGVIRSRRATRTPPADLLSLLVGARDEDTHASLSDEELRDEVIAVMHGGYEPLSDALTWAGYVLSQQPPVARPLEAELSSVLGHRAPTFEDVPALRITSLLIQEILRLYPPAWGIGRTALADDTIGGYRVPAGSLVVLSPWVVHRDTRWWEAPDTCDPERFSPERSANRHRLAYFPFAAGPRMCIGRDFAMMEAGLILASLWQRYRLELRSGPSLRPVARYGLEPSAPMLMRIIPA
jgi:cytochrome P450